MHKINKQLLLTGKPVADVTRQKTSNVAYSQQVFSLIEALNAKDAQATLWSEY